MKPLSRKTIFLIAFYHKLILCKSHASFSTMDGEDTYRPKLVPKIYLPLKECADVKCWASDFRYYALCRISMTYPHLISPENNVYQANNVPPCKRVEDYVVC